MGFPIWVSVFLTLLLNLSNITTAQEYRQCPDNLSPCTCENDYSDRVIVRCFDVPMEEVKSVFNKTDSPIDIYDLYLTIRLSGDFIPADLLGQSKVFGYLKLFGYLYGDGRNQSSVTVDPNAFRSSNNTLTVLHLANIDTSQLDFGFLTGFQNLTLLYFEYLVTNFDRSLPTLPSDTLPSLTNLIFYGSPDLNKAFDSGDFFLHGNGITDLTIRDCGLDEMGFAKLLDWLLPSSAQTLRTLEIDGNGIRSTPEQMALFTNLYYVQIYGNSVDLTLTNNSIQIPSDDNFANLDFSNSRVVHIESGTFQGNYRYADVSLNGNLLTRFEEGVFKSMLEDMEFPGSLLLYSNPFDCYSDPCHLVWLLEDNRQLLDKQIGGQCNDGTYFEDITPILFAKCKEVPTSAAPTAGPDASSSSRPTIFCSIWFSILILYSLLMQH